MVVECVNETYKSSCFWSVLLTQERNISDNYSVKHLKKWQMRHLKLQKIKGVKCKTNLLYTLGTWTRRWTCFWFCDFSLHVSLTTYTPAVFCFDWSQKKNNSLSMPFLKKVMQQIKGAKKNLLYYIMVILNLCHLEIIVGPQWSRTKLIEVTV